MKKIWLVLLVIGLIFTVGCAKNSTQESAPKEEQEAQQTEDKIDDKAEDKAEEEKEEEEESETGSSKVETILEELLQKAKDVHVLEEEGAEFVVFPKEDGSEEKLRTLPSKVAVLNSSLATLYEECGGKVDVAIGGERSSENSLHQLGYDFTAREGVEILAETFVAKNWDMEKLLAIKPDLVIAGTVMGAPATLEGPMNEAKIPLLVADYSGIEDYLKWFKVFSILIGNKEAFEEKALPVAREVAEILAAVPEQGPRVLSLMPGSKSIRANLKHSEMGTLLDQLHAVNVADQVETEELQKVELSTEDMLRLDPDMILIQPWDHEERVREILNSAYGEDPIWNNLRAVKEDKVIFLDHDLYHLRPNGRYGEAYRKLAQLLYPEGGF